MKIKVCGMKDKGSIRDVAALSPDYMGFIFYPRSPRFAIGVNSDLVKSLPKNIKKVGVFVYPSDYPAAKEEIAEYANIFGLDAIQLHGDETPELCRYCQRNGWEVIKAFKVPENAGEDFFKRMEIYLDSVDLFLFDTAGKAPGGNGEKFDWKTLQNYKSDIPFLISGGIGPEDVREIKKGLPDKCVGIDINSRFEIEPGLKDVSKVSGFINTLRDE